MLNSRHPDDRQVAAGLMAEVKRMRLKRGLKQGDVAKRIGRSQSMVSAWESMYSFPDLANFASLARAVGFTIALEEMEPCTDVQQPSV